MRQQRVRDIEEYEAYTGKEGDEEMTAEEAAAYWSVTGAEEADIGEVSGRLEEADEGYGTEGDAYDNKDDDDYDDEKNEEDEAHKDDDNDDDGDEDDKAHDDDDDDDDIPSLLKDFSSKLSRYGLLQLNKNDVNLQNVFFLFLAKN